ncbi:serine/threonine-protein kinase Smg1 [Anopheles maculipalpis]|uniref:serine/threonine-protein kinase Smg1 n=1 Tax=Anopheles maculipalpis TaxID=1496333 RepID=UPI002158FCC3|nr:serine/threonine-protein kinase Smg1 [Anopheles maculipalpis]
MGGKADSKQPQQQCTAKRISRRNKKKPTDHQRQSKSNTGGTAGVRGLPSEQYDTEKLATPVGAPTGGKRYQSTRSQAASQRRERARKLAAETERTGQADGRDGASLHELANIPADMRISKLLRRLVGETNPHQFLEICDRLEVVILDPSNASYIRKSFDLLANTVNAILESGLRECYERVAQLFGMMLYVLLSSSSGDGSVLRAWTNRYLNQNKSIRRSALIALRQTVLLDRGGHKFDGVIKWLLGVLQEILETTDVLDVFVLVTDVIVELADRYPRPFSSHFSDIVDIVVGWQLESTQSAKVKVHCARVLLAFQPYWCEQRDVTFNLLEQLTEDIDAHCGDVDYSDERQRDDANRQLGALLTAINSVMKCLDSSSVGDFLLQDDELTRFDCCSITILENVFRLLKSPPSGLAVAAICEFLMIKMMLHSPAISTTTWEDVDHLIQKLIHYADTYSDEQVGALIHLLLRYIDANGPEKQQSRIRLLLPLIFQEGPFYNLRYRQKRTVQRILLLLCHHILTLKHVDILQTAYSSILSDIDDALGRLRSVGSRTPSKANILRLQYRIQFSLLLLSPLAMARNSIFITWTLKKQPVLHVLLDRLAPTDSRLWDQQIHTHLHYAVLLTAFNHCTANNHFISSSSLLQPAHTYDVDRFRRASRSESSDSDKDSPPESPTADHFGLVLRFLGTILGQWKRVRSSKRYESQRTNLLLLLLDWCLAIVTQTTRYHDVLHECEDFNQLLVHVATVAVEDGSESETIGLRCAACLDAACQYTSLHVSAYQAIAEACCVHLCSVYSSLRTHYTVLFSKLPLRHSLRQVNEFTGVNRRRWEQIGELKNGLYQGGGGYGLQHSATLRMADLRSLFNRITFSRDGAAYAGGYLHELLTRSFNQPSRYGEMALRDLRCLIPWAQWEAAQLCVNHKLRTPFGKPEGTFVRIESIVKQCARILALTDKFPVRDIRTSIVNQRHARIVLGFLEALEKSIYNAAEGTAFALPAPEQPARTFFRVNRHTCAEWFTRIRTAVDLVALHCMEPEMVIRYSEAVLRELVAAGKTSDPIFEHMLMSLVWALVRNWESDALYGVYVWSKRLTGRKYSWIRMAAEEASGHRETAASGFRGILADPGSVGMDRYIRDFIVDQTILCLLFTGDYRQLYEFLLAEESSGTPRATIPLITVTATQISSIIRYEETHDVSVIDISQWELVDVGNNIPNDFSCHKMICAVENSLSGIILQDQIEQRERMIDASTELIQCYLQECLLTRCREYLFQLTITNHILYKIAQRIRSPNSMCGSAEGSGLGSLNVEKFYGTLTLMRLLAWSEFLLADSGDGYEGEQQNIDLRLDMVSIGRKEKNYALSRRELEKYYHKSNLVGRLEILADGGIGTDRHQQQQRLTLEQVASALMKSATLPPLGLWDENLSRAVYEHCKWLYCQPGKRLEAIDFAACATAVIDGELQRRKDGGPEQTAKHSERVARFLLTISDWMAGEAGEPCANELASVTRLGQLLPSIDAKPLTVQHAGIFGPSDRLIGTLLQGAVDRCPPLAKAWFALGSWLYRWGKRIVEHSAADGSSARISVDQVAAILAGPTVSLEDCERIVGILNDHEPARVVIGVDSDRDAEDADELELDSSATIGSIGLLDALHRAMPGLESNVPQESLHAIIDIWRTNHRAVYGYYEAAAEAYFRFLQLSSGRNDATSEGVDSERARSVTVTLRLLRLIVKHALGLKEVLEEGLATTPSEPWRVITPQLFSRLAHHEPYVRRRVSELLCRVAKDAPHLIIFPAVVGSVQEEPSQLAVVDVLRDGVEEVSSRIDEPVDQSQAHGASGLGFCFNVLLDILSREIPDTVKQVQTLVHELRRISLLWEELWVVSLQQIYADYTKRIPTFESEYRRLHSSGQLTEQRRTLLAEKHRLLLRPLIFVLDQLYGITSRKAETSHERHFQARYHRYIRHMLAKLREPADFTGPIEGWNRFRTLYTQLQQRSQKRFSFFLRLGDVSPNLLRLSNTAIAMPGIDTTLAGSRQPILIRSVDNNIQILPTKTRPKKLTFCGNDGRRFGYLSKGLEDLHLDERIMQFLSIANLMMTKSIDCNGNVTHYQAEHYSVIPLGPRSGLITWVDNTVPIFSLYKKWQQREALQKKETKSGGSTALRPSELFYNKLTPLLQSHGLKSSASRREWPLAVLKQVLAELQQETPRDLLAKELWCHSATASSWRQVIRSYSLSLAVMSVIGYIIGLGDRHLDNVLVKLATGEIVHIDYNVCFEKGKTLRVPEKVPFRMTPNLEEALGLTGIEGTFRLACEHVLKSLKKGRETLLTLLEAFVYDPLVDWAIGEEIGSGLPMTATDITVSTAAAASNAPGTGQGASRYISQAKKQLDREVTRDTLAVRFAECRNDWYQNRDDMLQHLLCLQKLLRDLREVRSQLVESERLRTSLSQQLQLIGEVEYLDTAFSSHPLASLAHRLSMRARLQEVYASQRDQLSQQAKLFAQQLEEYEKYRNEMQNEERLEMLRYELADVPELVQPDDDTQQLLVAFLPKDDPGYIKYSFARTELSELQRRAAPVAERIVELLEQYGVRLPSDSLEDHPLHHYASWYEQLANSNPEPAAALETMALIVREHEKARKLYLATHSSSKKEENERNQANQFVARLERIMVLNRALIDAERATVDGDMVQLHTLSAVASHLLEECTKQGLIADSTLGRCLHRTVAEYEQLMQFYEMLVPLQNGHQRREQTGDREVQLNEQFEQLVLNVEHCLRQGQCDNGSIGDAAEIARMLVNSWTELVSDEVPRDVVLVFDDLLRSTSIPWIETFPEKLTERGETINQHNEATLLGVWHYKLPEPWAQQISELTETLLQAAKFQAMYELLNGASPQQKPANETNTSYISVDRFIKRFVRLRLAGRGPLAALFTVQESDTTTAGTAHNTSPANDTHWLQNLTEAVQALAPIPELLLTAFEQLKRHTEALRNRLAWASAAHPPLCPLELPVAFEQSSSHSVESSSRWIQSLERILRYGQIVMRYEGTRHRDEPSLASEFAGLVERWQKTLTGYTVRGASFVSPTEEALVELLDPEGSIDPTWISNVRALIDDMTDQVLTNLARLEQDECTLRTALQAAAKHMLKLVHKHDDVMGDIRSLLRTQLRIGGSSALRDYLHRYRRFHDLLSNAHEAVLATVTSANDPSDTTGTSWSADDVDEMVDELLTMLHDVFEQLFQFDEPPDDNDAGQDDKEIADGEREEDEEDDDVSGTDGASCSVHLHDPVPPPDRKEQKQKEQKEQKRNAYAVSVWRRIRMKLEGRDPDPVRRCGVTEQVAWMIDEAMDPSNLAVVYEGWTPWV